MVVLLRFSKGIAVGGKGFQELALERCRLLNSLRLNALSRRALVPRYLAGARSARARLTAKARKGELFREPQRQ
jgi:hypothetical protein